MQKPIILNLFALITSGLIVTSCMLSGDGKQENNNDSSEEQVSSSTQEMAQPEVKQRDTSVDRLPYSDSSVRENVVLDYGKRAVRIVPDASLDMHGLMKVKKNCFIVMSKKDYYLYVYEAQGKDTVMLARYDCAFGLKKGNKERKGDMKTPHCTMAKPFTISQLAEASTWKHDFGDGRGNIKAYGDYFLRLVTPGHSGIGIHGSTNNRESVPGRASEGCIRLKDEDIVQLRQLYAFVGMKVIIKGEDVDDYPFEVRAMKAQNIVRLRHLDPATILTNEQIQKAELLQASTKPTDSGSVAPNNRKNMTLEERMAQQNNQ